MAKLHDALHGVDIYRVGALYDLWHIYRMIRFRQFRQAARKIRWLWRNRKLHAYRSYWNGYLAEATGLPVNAGHGWTRRRALDSLHREVEAAARNGKDTP